MTPEVAVIGIGEIGPLPPQEREGLDLAASALLAAADDAGIALSAIDGLVVDHGGPLGPDYDQFAQYLDLRLKSCIQTWSHGRFSTVSVQIAAMMIGSGQAEIVACVDGYHREGLEYGGTNWHGWVEEMRTGGGPHGEDPMAGLTAPLGPAAMAARAYCELYGVSPDELFHVVAAERRNASRNPRSRLRTELDRESYFGTPLVVEPLRRPDCAIVSESGCAVIVASPRAASALPGPHPLVIGSHGIPAGREQVFWGRPGLGLGLQTLTPDSTVVDTTLADAGLTPDDVDVFFTYDAFSPLIWFGLERFGFCAPGRAPAFVHHHGIAFDGAFPVNTSGGMLCAGSPAGWGHLIEMVHQLRGESGARQVRDAEIAMWGSCFGDALILRAS